MRLRKTRAPLGADLKRSAYTDDYPTVQRCMAFIDMSSFTSYMHAHGSHAAASKVSEFRSIIRTTTGRHCIRVARWLGDGAMLVGLDSRLVIDALCDIAEQCYEKTIPIHCGVANGDVIIFEGDDYLGRTVNIASRLSHMADSTEAFCYNIKFNDMPINHTRESLFNISVRGAGDLPHIVRLKLIEP